jgi:hypothetical protein
MTFRVISCVIISLAAGCTATAPRTPRYQILSMAPEADAFVVLDNQTSTISIVMREPNTNFPPVFSTYHSFSLEEALKRKKVEAPAPATRAARDWNPDEATKFGVRKGTRD